MKDTVYRRTTCNSLGRVRDSWVVDGLGCKMSYKFPSIRIESVFEGAPPPSPGDGALDDGAD